MGTDIHPRCEIMKKGVWFDVTAHVNMELWDFLEQRNYTLFAVLANVRNGYGFAGVKTGDPLRYISHNRGIPSNSPNAGQEESYMFGDHSLTWVTLKELIDYDWEQINSVTGVISEEQWLEFRRKREPPMSYSQGVSGRNIVTISEKEAKELYDKDNNELRRDEENEDVVYYVRVEWQTKLINRVGNFVKKTIPYLQSLVENPHHLRIVMGFDS